VPHLTDFRPGDANEDVGRVGFGAWAQGASFMALSRQDLRLLDPFNSGSSKACAAGLTLWSREAIRPIC